MVPLPACRQTVRVGDGNAPLVDALVRARGVAVATAPTRPLRSLSSKDSLREGRNEDLGPSHSRQPGLDGRGPSGVARSLARFGRSSPAGPGSRHRSPWASLLQGLPVLPRPLGQVTRPVVHQHAPALEQVGAGIGRLHPVPNLMPRATSITTRGWSVFSHSGILVTVLFPADVGMNWSRKRQPPTAQEWSTISARGGQADGAVWVSPFQMGGVTSKGDMNLIPKTLFSQRAGFLAVVVLDFPETLHQTRDNTDCPRPLRSGDARPRLACPPPARRAGAPHERGGWWRERPRLFRRWCATGEG